MVPRRRAQPRLEPLALPLPAGARSPTRTSSTRTARAGPARPGVRAARHRRLRRGPVLDHRGHYAKASADDLLMTVKITNAGPDADTLHVLPTAWFRNTWSWDAGRARKPGDGAATGDSAASPSSTRSSARLSCSPAPGRTGPADGAVLRERDQRRAAVRRRSRSRRTRRTASTTTWSAARATVNPEQAGTKCAFWYQLTVRRGETAERAAAAAAPGGRRNRKRSFGAAFDQVDRAAAAGRGRRVLRRADPRGRERRRGAGSCARRSPGCCGASSSTTTTWRAGWTATRASRRRRRSGWPAATRAGATSTPSTSCRCRTSGSTRGSRPGTWPSTASRWPTSIPAFAKYQLVLLCREWFQHPNGALPAYEWDFGDVNPPVQAWAALEVFAHRRRPRPRLPQPDLRQAAGQLHLVGEPGGRRRQQPVRGRLPRPRQHRPDRPLAPAGRRHASSSPTRPAGWRSTRWPCAASPPC